MPPLLWLSIMIVGFPLVFYLPTHLALAAWFPDVGQTGRGTRLALEHQREGATDP
jgi:hypothetical protein